MCGGWGGASVVTRGHAMTYQVKKPDGLSLMPITHIVDGEDMLHKLSCNLHKGTMTPTCALTINKLEWGKVMPAHFHLNFLPKLVKGGGGKGLSQSPKKADVTPTDPSLPSAQHRARLHC